jgi:hypothetical protein
VGRAMGARRPAGLEDERFWTALDTLIATSTITIDRPRGSTHPSFDDEGAVVRRVSASASCPTRLQCTRFSCIVGA